MEPIKYRIVNIEARIFIKGGISKEKLGRELSIVAFEENQNTPSEASP
jgi:hypothetical protein